MLLQTEKFTEKQILINEYLTEKTARYLKTFSNQKVSLLNEILLQKNELMLKNIKTMVHMVCIWFEYCLGCHVFKSLN